MKILSTLRGPPQFKWAYVLLIFVAANSIARAPAAAPIWQFGFYWSLTAAEYPPSAIPWSAYSHVAQFGILPTPDCELDEHSYAVSRIRELFLNQAHSNRVKALVTLVHNRDLKSMQRCTSPDRIGRFSGLLAEYVNRYGYDGLDLDWEAGVEPAQYQNLVRRLRQLLPDKILTADIAVHQRSYLVPIQDLLDRINLMNYDMGGTDYDGRKLNVTWHNAAIRADGDFNNLQSAEANLVYLTQSGIKASKINLGVPFYGYVYQGCTVRDPDDGKCAKRITKPGERINGERIRRTQIEYRRLVSSEFYRAGRQWHENRQSPYISFKGSQSSCAFFPCSSDAFITYSDPEQMRSAVSLLMEKQLGGIMTFALHQEFLPSRHGEERYPLSWAIHHSLELAVGRSDPLPAQ